MGDTPKGPLRLAAFELFAGCDEDDLHRLESSLTATEAGDGDVLMGQDDPAARFGVIVGGEAVVERTDGLGTHRLAVAGPGSIVGELALLRGTTRSATVTARGRVEWLVGDRDPLAALFALSGLHERVAKQAAQKLAAQATPVRVALKHGDHVIVRPLLPEDRAGLVAGIDHLSAESRRRRFFTGGSVPSRIVDYLVDLDYTNHFAWVAFTDDPERRGVGVSRYIRSSEDHRTAELAVAVVDDHQGIGLGSLLVGALAAAAQAGGIRQLSATALADNTVVKALLGRAGASWVTTEPGAVGATVGVHRLVGTLAPDLADTLRSTAAATMSASHVALT